MKNYNYNLSLDSYEHGIIINALNNMRTDQLQAQRPIQPINELLEKIINLRPKRLGLSPKGGDRFESR